MGRLWNRIISETLSPGISFNQTYNLPPTEVGNGFPTLGWASDGTFPPVYSSTQGPFPGEGSWYFNEDNTATPTNIRTRVTHTASFGNSNNQLDLIKNCNYTVGAWVKCTNWNETAKNAVGGILRTVSTSGGAGNIPYYIGVGWNVPSNQKAIIFNTGGANITIDETAWGKPFENDEWYYLAIRKTTNTGTGENGANATITYYINGVAVSTGVYPVTAGAVNQFQWGISAGLTNFTLPHYLANYHLAHSSDITAADIQAIWNQGSPMQLPLRHYDGDSWELPTDKKVYYNGMWNPIYANQWNGTSWVAI